MITIAVKPILMAMTILLASSSVAAAETGQETEQTDGGLVFYDGEKSVPGPTTNKWTEVLEAEEIDAEALEKEKAEKEGMKTRHAVKRVAHMKNSEEAVAEAYLFDGIEVDVQETDGDGKIRLYHDDYMDYTLDMFLDHCLETGQMAVLDMKSRCTYADVVNLVTEKGMIANTVFQVGRGEQAQLIREYNPNARCWLLNGIGNEGYLNLARLNEFSDCFEGVNVCGTVVVADYSKESIDAVHSIKGSNGPMTISIFGFGENTSVYGGDETYIANGVDYLVTDLHPEG